MQITPTSFLQLPLEKEVNQLDIVINPFRLFPSEITVNWVVTGDDYSKTGTMTLPQSIIDAWGTDDTVVETYVLEQLNLSKDTTSTTTTTETPIV